MRRRRSLRDRVAELERTAHEPVEFLECRECGALVAGPVEDGAWELHLRWHRR